MFILNSSFIVKKKLTTLEDELNKAKKENEQLSAQLKSDTEMNEKNLQSMKQKAELKMASIKVCEFSIHLFLTLLLIHAFI